MATLLLGPQGELKIAVLARDHVSGAIKLDVRQAEDGTLISRMYLPPDRDYLDLRFLPGLAGLEDGVLVLMTRHADDTLVAELMETNGMRVRNIEFGAGLEYADSDVSGNRLLGQLAVLLVNGAGQTQVQFRSMNGPDRSPIDLSTSGRPVSLRFYPGPTGLLAESIAVTHHDEAIGGYVNVYTIDPLLGGESWNYQFARMPSDEVGKLIRIEAETPVLAYRFGDRVIWWPADAANDDRSFDLPAGGYQWRQLVDAPDVDGAGNPGVMAFGIGPDGAPTVVTMNLQGGLISIVRY